MTLKNRIMCLLPTTASLKSLTTKQLVARLNSSSKFNPVTNATVRGRLSELISAGLVATVTRPTGRTGFYLGNNYL